MMKGRLRHFLDEKFYTLHRSGLANLKVVPKGIQVAAVSQVLKRHHNFTISADLHPIFDLFSISEKKIYSRETRETLNIFLKS